MFSFEHAIMMHGSWERSDYFDALEQEAFDNVLRTYHLRFSMLLFSFYVTTER